MLKWDKPEKIMTTAEWMAISADCAPPGVYTPNMSREDMLEWKAKYTGGRHPRVEIRKTVIGKDRRNEDDYRQNYAQLKVIVDADSVRLSGNGTADFSVQEFAQLFLAVSEARVALHHKRELKGGS